jgi:hypothetical protein
MLPSLKILRAGLRRTTEALGAELAAARPATPTPDWSALEWQLAMAVAAGHGVSPLLCKHSAWQNAEWRSFVETQREHVAHRHNRIAALLERIDLGARAAGLAIIPLKGSALHALHVYSPGERPMADVDLLVRECDAGSTGTLLQELGYVESFTSWKHRVFKPVAGRVMAGLGEHRDNQISIELHTRIREQLPVSVVDITARVYPRAPRLGLNAYPSIAGLMSHLLLHTAGNIRSRSLRLLHLNDIARLAARMTTEDWNALWDEHAADAPWWALPPLLLTARYYQNVIPESVLARLESSCPAWLRMFARRQTLTQASSSDLWIQALPGIEWSRSVGEAGRYIRNRVQPKEEANRERMAVAQTQPWMGRQSWATLSRRRQILVRLTRRVPRMDTLYLLRSALADQGRPVAPDAKLV